MKKKISIFTTLLISFFLFTNCSEDTTEEIDKVYTISLSTYQYAGSEISETPLSYLETLKLTSKFSLPSNLKQAEADKQAITRFNKEMDKIDQKKLDQFKGTYYILYELNSVFSDKVIAQKSFGTKE